MNGAVSRRVASTSTGKNEKASHVKFEEALAAHPLFAALLHSLVPQVMT
jgi:hypothetical protein